MVPTNDLHALPSFAEVVVLVVVLVVGQEGGGGGVVGFTGLISFAAYSWKTILRPVPPKMIKFKINFDTVELQKMYGKIKVF